VPTPSESNNKNNILYVSWHTSGTGGGLQGIRGGRREKEKDNNNNKI